MRLLKTCVPWQRKTKVVNPTGSANRIVLITGAASGIGLATAQRFYGNGNQVVTWDLKPGPAGDFYSVDVTNTANVKTATAQVIERYGRIDVLINNAGLLRDAQLHKMTDEQFDSLLSVNLRGVFACTRAVVPHMIRQKNGVILNASSVVGLYGNFGQTNYVASKAGVIGMTKVWARELGKYNIRVNAVAPGFIATEMIASMPEKVLNSMREHTPLGRLGEPEDIANAYFWLASDEASFITGTVLSVDGGVVVGT